MITTLLIGVDCPKLVEISWSDTELQKTIRKSTLSVLRKKLLQKGKSDNFECLGQLVDTDINNTVYCYGYTEGTNINSYYSKLIFKNGAKKYDRVYDDMIFLLFDSSASSSRAKRFNQCINYKPSLENLSYLKFNQKKIDENNDNDDEIANEIVNEIENDDIGLDDEQNNTLVKQLNNTPIKSYNNKINEIQDEEQFIVEDCDEIPNDEELDFNNELREEKYNYTNF